MRYRPLPSKEGGYTRTGSRTPMQWDDGANLGFSQAAAEALYLPVDPAEDAPTVERAMANKNSLWHTIRPVLTLRADEPALHAYSGFDVLYGEGRAFAFSRRAAGRNTVRHRRTNLQCRRRDYASRAILHHAEITGYCLNKRRGPSGSQRNRMDPAACYQLLSAHRLSLYLRTFSVRREPSRFSVIIRLNARSASACPANQASPSSTSLAGSA